MSSNKMSKIIKSLKINAVDRSTTFRDIMSAFDKYAVVSHIYINEFETSGGGKYNRVFIDIDRWKDTPDAKDFINQIRNGRARLNYWWDVQDNTNILEQELEQELEEEEPDEYLYDDGTTIHRYEWKDMMRIVYGEI